MARITQEAIDHREKEPCWCSDDGRNNKHPGGERHHLGCSQFGKSNTSREDTLRGQKDVIRKLIL